MPLIPQNGPQDPVGFGPNATSAPLGAGAYPGQELIGGNPTDPSAEVSLSGLPPITPGGVAEAMQNAIEARQAQFADAAQQQLVADLDEAATWVEQVMATVGAEATTLDGAAGVPSGPLPVPAAAPPGGPDAGGGIAAALAGEGSPPVAPEELAAILGGAGGLGL